MSFFKKDHKPSIMRGTPLDPVKMQMQIERSARWLTKQKAKEAKLSKRK